jgi:hypothetical protein
MVNINVIVIEVTPDNKLIVDIEFFCDWCNRYVDAHRKVFSELDKWYKIGCKCCGAYTPLKV